MTVSASTVWATGQVLIHIPVELWFIRMLCLSLLQTDLREIGKGWLPEDVNRGRADYVRLQFGKSKRASIKLAMSSKKVLLNMPKLYRFRSSCAWADYHAGLCSPLVHSVESNDSVSGQ